MSSNFDDAYSQLKNIATNGDKARRFKESEWSGWLEENVFKVLDREAITKMKLAKTEEERIMAQQMFLAAEKPRALIDYIINQGNGAVQELRNLYPKEDENGNRS